jgi:hypothetical protein
MGTDVIARPSAAAYEQSGAAIQRTGFGEQATEDRRETQATTLAERAKAEISARYIVALQRPRNVEEMRVRLLAHCARKGFAERAEYAKPVGTNKVHGPSIRFVETALQEYGNVSPDSQTLYDDDQKRVVRVSVTDLERNVSYSEDVVVEKFVERRNARGAEVIGTRITSSQETVFKVRATEDDFANKLAAAVSKKIRNLGLRILPVDIVDDAMAACKATRTAKDKADPDGARRGIVDAFAAIGVMPRALDEYLGHPLAESSPAELDDLRMAFATVRDGEARWIDLVDAKRADRGEIEEPTRGATDAAAKVRERLARRQRVPVAPAPDDENGGT